MSEERGGRPAFAPDSILDRIVAWANGESNVRALVLVGSRAGDEPTDEIADLDVQVYAETIEAYTGEEAWLSMFAPVWVCVRDEYRHGDLVVPTRLVVFEGGAKVDFALYPAEAASDVDAGEPWRRILIDKDGVAPDSERGRTTPEPPREEEFVRIVEEFWFEAYHVAKYLARGELWLAKARDWETKRFLLKMIEWHAGAEQESGVDARPGGRLLHTWVQSYVWAGLDSAFSHFDADDSWRGLDATIELFRRLARETASALGTVYPDEVDRNISGFIADLASGRR